MGDLCLQEGCLKVPSCPHKCKTRKQLAPDSRTIRELQPMPFCSVPQPPPKLPNGVFTQDFQEFVNKW